MGPERRKPIGRPRKNKGKKGKESLVLGQKKGEKKSGPCAKKRKKKSGLRAILYRK